jgi:Ca2+-binding EF-hand superfamily protein
MDKNHDQQISRDEWTRRPQAFDRIDSNHDGLLTREELRAARDRRRQRDESNRTDPNKPPQ